MVLGTGTTSVVVHPLLLFVSVDYERILVDGVGYFLGRGCTFGVGCFDVIPLRVSYKYATFFMQSLLLDNGNNFFIDKRCLFITR